MDINTFLDMLSDNGYLLAIAVASVVTALCPTRLEGGKWYHKAYNFIVGFVNIVALNILKNRNADAVKKN